MSNSLLNEFGEFAHRDTILAKVARKIGSRWLLAIDNNESIPTTPTISSVTTTDGSWTLVASGLTDIVEWSLVEVNGSNFNFAYVAAPGSNFNVAFGWVSKRTSPSAIYVQRPTDTNITVKFERWST